VACGPAEGGGCMRHRPGERVNCQSIFVGILQLSTTNTLVSLTQLYTCKDPRLPEPAW
jgi:hypothetical protein